MRGKSKLLIFLALLALALWYGFSLRKDLTPFKSPATKTSLTLTNVQAHRKVGDEQWQLSMKEGREEKGLQQGKGIEGSSQGPKPSAFKARQGTFAKGKLTLQAPKGFWTGEGNPIHWQGDSALWQQNEDLWTLKGAVSLRQEGEEGPIKLKTERARWTHKNSTLTTETINLDYGGKYHLTAPQSAWHQAGDQWTFDKGVTFSGPQGSGVGDQGQLIKGKEVQLLKGRIQWNDTP